jgi:uncharacterized protein
MPRGSDRFHCPGQAMSIEFEWDEHKALANLAKHGVSFEEAREIFYDPFELVWPDDEHSENEQRLISLGETYKGSLLMVVYAERQGTIRLISARRAMRSHRRFYEQKKRHP